MSIQQPSASLPSSPPSSNVQPGCTQPLNRFMLGITTAFAILSGGGAGAILFSLGYWSLAVISELIYERWQIVNNTSYGQFYALIMLPLAACFGGLAGASLSSWLLGMRWLAAILAILTGTLFLVAVVGLWLMQAKSSGFGAADIFMYPPLILSAIVLLAFGLSLRRVARQYC